MIDIHTHVIPFIDDGSPSLQVSLEMLKSESEAGVTTVIATPHYHVERDYTADVQTVRTAFEKLESAVKEAGIPINLLLGQEICFGQELNIPVALQRGKLLPIANTECVLVEFSYDEPLPDFWDKVIALLEANYVPVIAHVERYSWMNASTLKKLRRFGCELQANVECFLPDSPHFAYVQKLAKKGLLNYVASDVHSFRHADWKEAENNPLLKAVLEKRDGILYEVIKDQSSSQ